MRTARTYEDRLTRAFLIVVSYALPRAQKDKEKHTYVLRQYDDTKKALDQANKEIAVSGREQARRRARVASRALALTSRLSCLCPSLYVRISQRARLARRNPIVSTPRRQPSAPT